MTEPLSVQVKGLDDVKEALQSLPGKLRKRALLAALRAGARLVQREARAAAPVLSPASLAVRKGYRTAGLLRRKISVRTSKAAARAGDVGVFVNVRPAAGAKYRTTTSSVFGVKVRRSTQVRASERGAKSPLDPYYWRWVEFGTRTGTRAFGFLQRGARKLPEALRAFEGALAPAIAKLNRPKAPAP